MKLRRLMQNSPSSDKAYQRAALCVTTKWAMTLYVRSDRDAPGRATNRVRFTPKVDE